ncbi:hypothetical protein BDZ91DRAFT_799854 [Kalaharituber pfeilii]|nr:hypothetical protein BDZ91DRAFT_799854 [Kalaharituber pfeilii]
MDTSELQSSVRPLVANRFERAPYKPSAIDGEHRFTANYLSLRPFGRKSIYGTRKRGSSLALPAVKPLCPVTFITGYRKQPPRDNILVFSRVMIPQTPNGLTPQSPLKCSPSPSAYQQQTSAHSSQAESAPVPFHMNSTHTALGDSKKVRFVNPCTDSSSSQTSESLMATDVLASIVPHTRKIHPNTALDVTLFLKVSIHSSEHLLKLRVSYSPLSKPNGIFNVSLHDVMLSSNIPTSDVEGRMEPWNLQLRAVGQEQVREWIQVPGRQFALVNGEGNVKMISGDSLEQWRWYLWGLWSAALAVRMERAGNEVDLSEVVEVGVEMW